MTDKHLPIKIFEKRKDIDERDTEGGGNSKPPKWTLQGELLRQRTEEHILNLERAKNTLLEKQRKGSFLPHVIKTTINSDAIAKTHRKEISKLFETPEGNNVIGLSGEKNLLVKVNSVKIIENAEKRLSNFEKNAYVISAIDEFEDFTPIIESIEIKKPLKIKLINYCDFELNKSVQKLFESICNLSNGLHLKSQIFYTPEMLVYKLVADNFEALEDIKQFEGLYSIEIMPSYEVVLDFFNHSQNIPIKIPDKGKNYPVIGVLDSGIQEIPYLKPWILYDKYTNYPEEYVERSHGTFVAGILLYGDELQGKEYTGKR